MTHNPEVNDSEENDFADNDAASFQTSAFDDDEDYEFWNDEQFEQVEPFDAMHEAGHKNSDFY